MNAEIISWLEKAFPEGSSAGADFGADPVKADMLIELQHQLGQVTKMIEDLPKRLARTEAGGGNHTVPPRKKKA